mmetsp:Transcript_15658/g.24042  ORF Transcript_15658/g.24042 Transcript_15658/m.24042 type:complete len:88 (-) Transcript_15658:115-378(-)
MLYGLELMEVNIVAINSFVSFLRRRSCGSKDKKCWKSKESKRKDLELKITFMVQYKCSLPCIAHLHSFPIFQPIISAHDNCTCEFVD